MRVIQILPALHVGGVERGTIDWALALKQMGHVPMVISGGGHGASQLSAQGIQHIQLPVGKKSIKSLFLVKQLKQIFEEAQVDVVHARSRLPAWLSYWAIKKMNRKPAFVTTLHGLHTVSPYAGIMAKGDAVIAVSKTAKSYLQQHFPQLLKSEPVVVYRGIDEAEFPYGFQNDTAWLQQKHNELGALANRKKVLLPGRLSEIKGAMGLIPWLQNAPKDIVLVVNAKPEDSQFSRKFASALTAYDVYERVVWLGVERDMKQLYAWADVVLSVNKKPESFGRTVLEALTVGCPVVAFDHGGVSEVMSVLFPDGLVAHNDWQGLAEKVNQFLAQSPQVSPHKQFSNESQFKQTMAVYQSLLTKQ